MKILNTLKEVFLSSLPLLCVMVIVCGFISPFENANDYVRLFVSYAVVIVGLTLFLVGLENSILPMGKLVGGSLIKLKKTSYIMLFGLLFGLLATVAEPALSVLAIQVNNIAPEINQILFLWVLGFGIGAATALALWRIIKDISIKIVFLVLYALIFIMVFFVPPQYIALAFDGSGATTGDVSVPFILALGIGVSATMSKSKTNDESFGIVGIASAGPIIAVFTYGLIKDSVTTTPYNPIPDSGIGSIIVNNLQGVALALLPILLIFLVFQFFFIKLPKQKIVKILISSAVVFLGLLVFLSGIDYGFAMVGKHIGETFGKASINVDKPWLIWVLLPLCFVLGTAITLSEPAVIVLGEQVEEITNGYISKKTIRLTLAIAIGFASLLCMIKILTEKMVGDSGLFPQFLTDRYILWYLVPLYAIALILMPFTPKLFVGLAFDSGGVVGGAMVSAFLTPLMLGTSEALGQDILTSAFGMIAFISVTPLITVQILGIMYKVKTGKKKLVGAPAQEFVPAECPVEGAAVLEGEKEFLAHQTAELICQMDSLFEEEVSPQEDAVTQEKADEEKSEAVTEEKTETAEEEDKTEVEEAAAEDEEEIQNAADIQLKKEPKTKEINSRETKEEAEEKQEEQIAQSTDELKEDGAQEEEKL